MFRVLPPASPPPFVLLVNHAMFAALFVNLLFEPWRCQRWPRGVFPVEVCRVTSSCRAILSSYCRVTVELRSTCGRVTVELLSSFSSSCPVEARGTRVFQVRAERCVIRSPLYYPASLFGLGVSRFPPCAPVAALPSWTVSTTLGALGAQHTRMGTYSVFYEWPVILLHPVASAICSRESGVANWRWSARALQGWPSWDG